MTSTWYVKGTVQINNETEGYSPIVEYGETRPLLKIPSTVPVGWKRLTAVYSDEEKEKYKWSINRTLLYFGRKVWINCPCIFTEDSTSSLKFSAVLFSNNRLVPGGTGKFHYHKRTTSKSNLKVKNGIVSETYTPTKGMEVKNGYVYSFWYDCNEGYGLAPDVGYGKIYISNTPAGRTALTVEVETVIANYGELTRLVARVYHRKHASYIRHTTDIPSDGKISFYVDGKLVSYDGETAFDINEAGYVSIPFRVKEKGGAGIKNGKGIYNITATYIPEAPATKYSETSGCGTLCVGYNSNKPTISTTDPMCTYINNELKELLFTSNKKLTGTLQLYIDGELVHLNGTSSPDYALDVDGEYNVTLSFDTLGETNMAGYHWNYAGYHNFFLKYSTDDGGDYPLEHYYYNDFYILIPVEITIVGDEDNTTQLVDGEELFVGNNLYYVNKYNSFARYDNNIPSRMKPPSITVGSPIVFKVNNTINPENEVDEGYIRVTIKSRTWKTLENNLEDV